MIHLPGPFGDILSVRQGFTEVERRYAPVEATVVIGKIACEFPHTLLPMSLVLSPRDADELDIEGGISWKTSIVDLHLLSG